MYLTTKQVSKITGCTLRQLQYWREQKVIIPAIDAQGKGKSVLYEEPDLVAVMVIKKLLDAGLEYQKACSALAILQEQNPSFSDETNVCNRYLVIWDSNEENLSVVEFEVRAVQDNLSSGNAFIPLLLDNIYKEIRTKLVELEMDDNREKIKINARKIPNKSPENFG